MRSKPTGDGGKYAGGAERMRWWDHRAREGQDRRGSDSWRRHYRIGPAMFYGNLALETVGGGAKPVAIGIGGYAAIHAVGAGVGFVIEGIESLGRAIDIFNVKVGPAVSRVDEAVGKTLEEKTGPVGPAAVGIDQKLNDFWARLLGRTPESQQQFREKYGMQEPSYLQKPQAQAPAQKTQAGQPTPVAKTQTQQPSQPPILGPDNYARTFETAADLVLYAALAYAAVTTLPRVVRRATDMRLQEAGINAQLELAKAQKEAADRYASLEQQIARMTQGTQGQERQGGTPNEESTRV